MFPPCVRVPRDEFREIIVGDAAPQEKVDTVFGTQLIAPCGMNCGLCKAFLREKDPCPGCGMLGQNACKTRTGCKIRNCDKRRGERCFDCSEFPCEALMHLDGRYRAKYGMSQVNNLRYIRRYGLEAFLGKEEQKWVSEKGVMCVHDGRRYRLR